VSDELPSVYRDRFTPHQVLGAGVSGRVYLVTDGQTGKEVALKIPLDSSATLRLALAEELDNRLALQGPGVARVFAWRLDNAPFITMEVLRGGTLGTLLADTNRVYDLEHGVGLAMQWLSVASRMIAAHRYTIDFHYNNALFDAKPRSSEPWHAVWADLQLCFPTTGFGFYSHFPTPLIGVDKRMPLRGLYWGFNERDTQRVAIELVLSLCAHMRPRQRKWQARDFRAGTLAPVPVSRLLPYVPERVAHYLSERSALTGIDWGLRVSDIARELTSVTGVGHERLSDIAQKNEAPVVWPRELDAVLEKGGVCHVPRALLYSETLQARCEAMEPARGSFVLVAARPMRKAFEGALCQDVLQRLSLQIRITPSAERKQSRALLRAALAEHGAFVWRHDAQLAKKLELQDEGQVDAVSGVVSAMCALNNGATGVLVVEDPTSLSDWDSSVLAGICERHEPGLAVVIGK
jgi:hypothetical protein